MKCVDRHSFLVCGLFSKSGQMREFITKQNKNSSVRVMQGQKHGCDILMAKQLTVNNDSVIICKCCLVLISSMKF